MIREEWIAVFAYAFPHRKTQDFLQELVYAGFENIVVIAAPWRHLHHADSNSFPRKNLIDVNPTAPQQICDALRLQYHALEHDDVEEISVLCERYQIKLGLVAGARIIKRGVIELFEEGILNLHPGKIPETSGLDLFYYTIKFRVPMGVTAHYIDSRVDAGDILFFEEAPVHPDDKAAELQYNNYQTQIRALRRFISLRDRGELNRVSSNRPRKNNPMSAEEKQRVLQDLPVWRAAQVRAQSGRRLIKACEDGLVSEMLSGLDMFPDLLEHRSDAGWTPLIVAAFHQRADVVKALLQRGADPNASGKNGTTPLMYAKSALISSQIFDTDVLTALLAAGADLSRCDCHGKDIFHYLERMGDSFLSTWLKQYAGDKP